ncbi:PRC-barrel domain-containing protein [Stenomitos frigidus]|nr:PRC-barrel domain-containing protein [Stenomitos frigidus]
MTTLPDVIRQSDLLNQLVLDRATMEELGRVEVVWMYPVTHRVLGFVCKTGAFGAQKAAFKLSQISTLGSNGILTHNQPEATDATKVRQLESLLNCEVWSDTGNKIGKIIDYCFNLKTGAITHYLLASSGWAGIAGDLYQLPPAQVLSIGRKRVLVTDASAQTLAVYQSGIKQTLAKATSVLKEDYGQATEELRSLSKQAQAATEQAKGRLQSLRGQLKERARSLSQQAQETIQSINDQLQEEAQTLAEQARENSQVLAERMRERTQTFGEQFGDGIQILSEQVEDGIQTLTVQAKEILEPTADAPEQTIAPEQTTSASSTATHSVTQESATQASDQPSVAATHTNVDDSKDDDAFWDDDEPWIDDEPWSEAPINATASPAIEPLQKKHPNHLQKLDPEASDIDDDEPWI